MSQPKNVQPHACGDLIMVGKCVPFPPENVPFSSGSVPCSPEIVLPSHKMV
jgi:hypothetical protein